MKARGPRGSAGRRWSPPRSEAPRIRASGRTRPGSPSRAPSRSPVYAKAVCIREGSAAGDGTRPTERRTRSNTGVRSECGPPGSGRRSAAPYRGGDAGLGRRRGVPFGRRRRNDAAARGDSLKGRRRADPRAGSRAGEALVSPDRRSPDGRAVRRGGGFARHRDTAAPGRSVKIRSARVLRCTRPSDRRGPRSGPPYAFDASMICSINNAFYTVTRSSLRSSSIREPSDPPFGVIFSPVFQGLLATLRRSEAPRRAESPEAGGKARFRRRETWLVRREPLCRAPHGPTSPLGEGGQSSGRAVPRGRPLGRGGVGVRWRHRRSRRPGDDATGPERR